MFTHKQSIIAVAYFEVFKYVFYLTSEEFTSDDSIAIL
jgi:hypothetical protein